ncbi:MAG TPA: transposase [Candidatus Saccharimonadales bacterium]|nr:transposase [Candidatus Saccharimonadales bacterium]
MPSKNVLKVDAPDSYYHVYARGAGKQPIFLDYEDFMFFLELLRRYLSPEAVVNSVGTPYEKLGESVELLAYCLMGNHFHLLLFQRQVGGMQRLMRGVMTSYSRYFNRVYGRSGPLFESRYKASRVSNETYLQHISRYIHLNPKDWRLYPYSSMQYYLTGNQPDWLQTSPMLELFDSREQYAEFVADYEAAQRELDSLKHELADT